uniref:Host specificity protein n=2 Tax=Bradyrhizobium septentrionale TaxID=1404411 RepID=A0A974A3W7_9BRAD
MVEISRSSFERKMKDFHGDRIRHIAANPEEYSHFVSSKAERTVGLAKGVGSARKHTSDARYFSYELGNKSVGLLRTEGGFSMSDVFEGEKWKDQFPGRTEITSTTVLRVTHPLVDNAGDILLEHQLRLDGERPLVDSTPASLEAQSRLAAMGYVEVDEANMVLDPTQHPEKWTKNGDGEWQRADKPTLYLSKVGSGEDDDSESAESASTASSHDDFDVDDLTHALDDLLA